MHLNTDPSIENMQYQINHHQFDIDQKNEDTQPTKNHQIDLHAHFNHAYHQYSILKNQSFN